MLKRILIIALLTGTAQAFSVFSLKFLSAAISPANMSLLAQADSLLQLLLNIIALGLQSAAMRNIALSDNWKQEYKITQSARGTLSFFLFFFAASAFFQPANVIFLLAPLLAFSGDYALYAVGKPIEGAIAAFVRVVLPYGLMLLIAALSPGSNPMLAFVIGAAIAYTLTNFFISRQLQTPFFYKPRLTYLKLYVSSLPLGLVSLSLYFIGLGIVLIMPFFYPDATTAVVFVGLKFYMIFKGVLRIIHQAFLKEMVSERVCLKIDQLSIILGMIFFWSVLIFPKSFVDVFFGIQYSNSSIFFLWLSMSALLYSFFLSAATKSLLLKKDKEYTIATALAAFITIASFAAISYFWKSPTCAGISIFLGELTWIIGLILITAEKKLVLKRLVFILQNIPVALILLFFLYLFGDTISIYFTSIFIFCAIELILYYNKIKTLRSL